MKEEEDKRPFSELTKEERRARTRKLVFGEDGDKYMGNIWGTKFSMISLVGLSLVSLLAFYGIYTGKIDLKELEKENASSVLENPNPHLYRKPVKDSLKGL